MWDKTHEILRWPKNAEKWPPCSKTFPSSLHCSLSFPILRWDQKQESLSFDQGAGATNRGKLDFSHNFERQPRSLKLFLKTVKPRHLFQISHSSYLAPNNSLTSEAVHTWLKLNGWLQSGILWEKNFIRIRLGYRWGRRNGNGINLWKMDWSKGLNCPFSVFSSYEAWKWIYLACSLFSTKHKIDALQNPSLYISRWWILTYSIGLGSLYER